ncbi:MAG: Gfo/Idh/MocA family oxidoreductase [Lentisphaeria bacterium]|nr:Gfo/Idh/MocA family oxidoreductase [Lentisphaeria bacterium]
MIRIALMGCAHIHMPFFIKNLKDNASVFTAAVWDRQAERAESVASELNTQAVEDADTIWKDESITAVVIASETVFHEELFMKAVEHKKHIFVEKPLGFSAADAKRMAEVVEKSGLLFQTGYFMRGQNVNLYLKKLVDSGAFGTITRVRHANCHSGSLSGWFDGAWRWMADPEAAGCGAFGDLGTHSLDILMWLFGRPQKVTATIRKDITGKYGENCDESGEGLLLFPNGIIATLAGGWVDRANPVSCEISGTELHAVVINGALYLKSKTLEGADGVTPWTKDLPESAPHAFLLFLDALCGKTPALDLVSAQECAERSIVMEALYKSAADSCWVTPEY